MTKSERRRFVVLLMALGYSVEQAIIIVFILENM